MVITWDEEEEKKRRLERALREQRAGGHVYASLVWGTARGELFVDLVESGVLDVDPQLPASASSSARASASWARGERGSGKAARRATVQSVHAAARAPFAGDTRSASARAMCGDSGAAAARRRWQQQRYSRGSGGGDGGGKLDWERDDDDFTAAAAAVAAAPTTTTTTMMMMYARATGGAASALGNSTSPLTLLGEALALEAPVGSTVLSCGRRRRRF